MSLRQKLLLVMSLTVVLAVGAVAWIVSLRTRQAFAEADQKRTAAVVEQFQRELNSHAAEIAERVKRIAGSDELARIAAELARTGDPSPYVNEAGVLARDYQLDFLELLTTDGAIVSSAQWPARFGYKEGPVQLGLGTADTWAGPVPPAHLPEGFAYRDGLRMNDPGPVDASPRRPGFLRHEELPDGSYAVSLSTLASVQDSHPPLVVLGGQRLDRGFLASLSMPADTLLLLYPHLTSKFDPHALVSTTGEVAQAMRYKPLIDLAHRSNRPVEGVIYLGDNLTGSPEDSVDATAVPLTEPDGSVRAVMVVANSRRDFVELQQHIRAIAYGVAGVGILLAIAASLWITSRLSRPIERLAEAASWVAAGRWHTQVEVTSHDELGTLAVSFNHMTQQLAEQRERLVQSERVAAWRELARRLAHELKNPLFPLQLTVENLMKARKLPPEEFDEIFHESTTTLMAEIANLKNIIGRFSDFSKMPKPQLEAVDLADMVRQIASLYEPAMTQHQPPIAFRCELPNGPLPAMVDPELLHRAISNLVLNAMDAMPNGGTLTVRAQAKDGAVEVRVSDTGTGMTPEECERLFTPYYTTKQHGTGLGLAIVQSIVSDHGGRVRVESQPGSGSIFIVELPAVGARSANA